MESAAKLLAQAMLPPADEREDLAARSRAAEARRGVPGIAWDDLKRSLLK